jgi:hypothetical protein
MTIARRRWRRATDTISQKAPNSGTARFDNRSAIDGECFCDGHQVALWSRNTDAAAAVRLSLL